MKKIAYLLPLLILLWAVPGMASDPQADPAVLKAKLDQKVAQMKAAGATDEEIKAFVTDFKKKTAAMAAADSNGKPGIAAGPAVDPAILKAKMEQKIAQMKADGATDEEIKAFVTDFKKKAAAMAATDSNGNGDMAMYKEKLDRKIADMKAAGASDDEIKKMVTEFKKKVEAEKAKAEKEKAEQVKAEKANNGKK